MRRRLTGVPLGVRLLAGAAVVMLALFLLAVFGPPLPGPNLTDDVGLADDSVAPCDPRSSDVRDPATPPPPSRPAWRRQSPLPAGHDEVRAEAAGGRIYIAGGQVLGAGGKIRSVDSAVAYDPSRDRHRVVAPTPLPLDHSAVAAYRGDLYLVGGYSNGRPQGTMWRYSPQDDRWSQLPGGMAMPRAGHGAAVIGDRLYVVGGAPAGLITDVDVKPYGSMEIYDFKTGEWSTGPDIPTARHHFGVTALDGKLYALGGRVPGDFSLDTAERFDPETGKWEELPPLPQGTGGAAAVSSGREAIVVAGGDDNERWVTSANWGFDPKRGSWRRLPDIPIPRHGHAAAVADGRLYVFGGSPCDGFGRTDSVASVELN